MKPQLALILLLLFTALVPLPRPTQAQEGEDWRLQAINPQGALSPDHHFVAYRFTSPAYTHALADLSVGINPGSTEAFNIGIRNLAAETDLLIAGQPADASYFVPNVPNHFWTRSNPVWSPDGTKIAWTSNGEEVEVPSDAIVISEIGWFHLVVYDITTQQISIIATGLDQAEMIMAVGPDLVWTETGISLLYNSNIQREVITISLKGELISRIALSDPVEQFLPIQPSSIAAETQSGNWILIDPLAETVENANGVPELYSPLAPDTSLGIFARTRPDGVKNWYAALPDGRFQRLYFIPQALSADGTQIAYTSSGAQVWSAGQPELSIDYPGYGTWVWGPTAWRMRSGISGTEEMSVEIQSQISPAPLLMTVASDLFAWTVGDETPTRLTYRGDVSPAVISPDGTRAIFRTDIGPAGGSQTYREIWMIDLTTFETTPLIELAETGVEAARVSPVWSPDGSQIAFLELTPAGEQRLVVYTLADDHYQVLASDLPRPNNVFNMWVIWSDSWIAAVYSLPDESGTEVRVYQPDGTLIDTTTYDTEAVEAVYNVIVATWEESAHVTLITYDSLIAFSPEWGDSSSTIINDLIMRSSMPSQPEFEITFADDGWVVRYSDVNQDELGYDEVSDFHTISPSPTGEEFAFAQYGKVLIWRDGQVMQVPATGLENPGERHFVAWGPAEFDLDTVWPSSRIVNLPPALIGAMFPQLHIGETARVVVGQGANNLRATPNGELVGQIPEGGEVLVIEGPVWAEEMPWWRVNYNGQEGWTAEYGNGTHWLEPVVD